MSEILPPIVVTIFAIVSLSLNLIIILRIIGTRRGRNIDLITGSLALSIFGISMWIIAVYIQLIFFTEQFNFGRTLFSATGNLVISLGLIAMYSFVSNLVHFKWNLYQITYFSFIIGMNTLTNTILVFSVMLNSNPVFQLSQTVADIINFVLVVSVVYLVNRDLQLLLKENLNDTQRIQITLVRASILIGLLGILPIIVVSTIFDENLLSISFIIVAVALGLLTYAYTVDTRVVFILPHKTYLVILVNSDGVLKYQHNFETQISDDNSPVLISGVLTSITSIMSEFYDSEVNPKSIEFQSRTILLEWSKSFYIAVFSDRDSPIIREAMKRTIGELEREFAEDLDIIMSDSNILDLDDIINQSFYFIY